MQVINKETTAGFVFSVGRASEYPFLLDQNDFRITIQVISCLPIAFQLFKRMHRQNRPKPVRLTCSLTVHSLIYSHAPRCLFFIKIFYCNHSKALRTIIKKQTFRSTVTAALQNHASVTPSWIVSKINKIE